MVKVAKDIDRSKLQRVVAVINGKGGVLKTTVASNLAGFCAVSGWRTLVVDLDPQGDIQDDLGYGDRDEYDQGASLAKSIVFDDPVNALVNVRENLDVWMGGDQLTHASASLNAELGKNPARAKLALARLLERVADDYDMIILDCPPGEGPLQQAALGAARWTLVPTKSDKSSIKGLRKVAARFDEVIDVNPDLDLLGIVLTDVGTATQKKDGTVVHKHAERFARSTIAEMFGVDDIVFQGTIRHSETVAEQTRRLGLLAYELDERGKAEAEQGLTWWKIRQGEVKAELSAKSAGSVADDLQALAQQVINRITDAEESAVVRLEGAHA